MLIFRKNNFVIDLIVGLYNLCYTFRIKTYHKIELEDAAIAFGGLYKEYLNPETGEVVYSASIITLPPLIPQWNDIHLKSMPMMLDFKDKDLVKKWLDPSFQDVDFFEELLEPKVRKPMKVTKVDKPSKWNPIEDSFMITN